jgi:hypothetical protein
LDMKVTFDIECTPEEARKFIGLPDVAPMQDALMKEMQERMSEGMRSMEPVAVMKTWFPTAMQNMTDMQKMFWSQLGVNAGDAQAKK